MTNHHNPTGPRPGGFTPSEAKAFFPKQENSLSESDDTPLTVEVKEVGRDSPQNSHYEVVFFSKVDLMGYFADAVLSFPFGHHTVIRFVQSQNAELTAEIRNDLTGRISRWTLDRQTRRLMPG